MKTTLLEIDIQTEQSPTILTSSEHKKEQLILLETKISITISTINVSEKSKYSTTLTKFKKNL